MIAPRVVVFITRSLDEPAPKHHRGMAPEYYVGIDVSLDSSSVCVIDPAGKIVREAKVASRLRVSW